jgi:hypothetical protein
MTERTTFTLRKMTPESIEEKRVSDLMWAQANAEADAREMKFKAILIAGAGSVCLSGGGFGWWEVAFGAAAAICVYNAIPP